jgi:hypothetical protein
MKVVLRASRGSVADDGHLEHGAGRNAGMWAAPDETRDFITGQYRRAWKHVDATITELPLAAPRRFAGATVTLGHILVHGTAETQRHAGHADIVRELIGRAVGLLAGGSNMPSDDPGLVARLPASRGAGRQGRRVNGSAVRDLQAWGG